LLSQCLPVAYSSYLQRVTAPALLPFVADRPGNPAIVDPQFADAFANWLHIAEVSQRKAADADLDLRQRPVIAHPAKPFGKDFGLADLDRSLTIIHNFRFFKDAEQILGRRLRRMKMPPDRLGRLARDDCRERFDCRLLDFAEGAEVS